MATALEEKIENLGTKLSRLKAEGDKIHKSKQNIRPCLDFNGRSNTRKPPGDLFGAGSGSPVVRRTQLNLTFPREKCNERKAAIERELQEITKRSAVLVIDGKEYPFTIDDLDQLEEIGSGTCGVVNKMVHRATGTIMAVKMMGRTPIAEEEQRILMDLDVITRCNACPFIVQCYGLLISSSDVYVCMELMNTCLEKLLRSARPPPQIPEPILGKVAVSVFKALQYLKQEHGIMHRDVKPSNILLDERGNVKLCDFGISGRLVDSKAKTKGAGCAAYMAPERVEPPDPMNPDYDVRADVWSMGISLIELATGEFPYAKCGNEFEVLMKIINDPAPALPPTFSKHFQEFVRLCLRKDFRVRPKFDKLLEHPFLREYEDKEVDLASWYANITTYV